MHGRGVLAGVSQLRNAPIDTASKCNQSRKSKTSKLGIV